MSRAISPIADAVAFVRMLWLLRRMKPEVVEFSTPKAGLLGMVAAWICRVPVRIYFLRGLRLETAPGAMKAILLWSERIAAACAHTVVVNSRSLREQGLALGIVRSEKMELLGEGSSNGVDVARFSPGPTRVRADYGIPADAPVVGFSGRLTADKGLPELLEAFAAILRERPDCYLLLVGWFDASEDALGTRLRARVEGHPRIVCTGYVADTAPFYRAMDVLVHPSWREGFPNAVLEAAASGVPAVATRCTGSRDAVVPEVTGLLVPPGDSGAIANSVLRILDNRDLRASIAQAARDWAVTHFEQSRVLGEMVRLYRHLLTNSASETSTEKAVRPATGWTASL
jgi:glycosyltransferase involved in cell wall biosynthesis